ncbi:MAG TPA: hypothetical protein VGL61_18275 [Kofleriaceae bacterium]|jgi:hypothetical protein
MRWGVVLAIAVAACTHPTIATTPTVPTASVQPGSCAVPGRDGVMSATPKPERADRDLDGDGRPEIIVVDRAKCDALGNCYWNVFAPDREGACTRYLGSFAGAALEPLASRGDANMVDVRAYWRQNGGRMLLEPYRFTRGAYLIDDSDVLQCKRAADDRLECADTRR